jgi:hypothetical protein
MSHNPPAPPGFKSLLRHWLQLLNLFSVPLPKTVLDKIKATQRAVCHVAN